jgi:hypothetical protein
MTPCADADEKPDDDQRRNETEKSANHVPHSFTDRIDGAQRRPRP